MSILDGNVVLDREPNKGNKENRKNRNDKKNRRNRSYDNYDYSFNNSSYLPEEERGQVSDDVANVTVDHRADEINDFCDDFTDNVNNYRSLQDVVIDGLPDVIGYLKSYYSGKTTPSFIDAMNRLIKTISTTQFANTLSSILESGVWSDRGVYDKIWRSLAYALSLALETSYERMHTDVIRKYATVILPRMWKPEINELTTMNGITKDLALDLIIAIPLVNTDWNGANIDALYSRFLDKMLDHAEDNMDVLNWEVQGNLYDKFFGTGKTALKVIGKYLTSDRLKESESDVVNAVYKEFIKMLYSKLDNYDIEDIKYVFNYVAKYRAENKDKTTLFDVTTAKQYENVRKGLLAVMDENPSSMESLA